MNDQIYGAELIWAKLLLHGTSPNVDSFYSPSKPTYFIVVFFSLELLLGVYIYILRVNTIVCDLERIKIQGVNLVLKPR